MQVVTVLTKPSRCSLAPVDEDKGVPDLQSLLGQDVGGFENAAAAGYQVINDQDCLVGLIMPFDKVVSVIVLLRMHVDHRGIAGQGKSGRNVQTAQGDASH